jgi:hypothetical protein
MAENERQQRMVDRILEDERLRGDLEDNAATPLIAWAAERAKEAAADPNQPDEVVEERIASLRAAVREAAGSGDTDPQRLIALASRAFGQSASPEPSSAEPSGATRMVEATETVQEPAAAAKASGEAEAEAATEPSKATQTVEATTAPAPAAGTTAPVQPATTKLPERPFSAERAQPQSDHKAVDAVSGKRSKRSRLASYFKRRRGGR